MSEAFQTGQRIAGYELLFRLGTGGMGEVWASRRADARGTGAIALKLLRSDRPDRRSPMFLDEARTAVALRHPHIVSTFESGVERDLMFIAMELIPGPSLHSLQRAVKKAGVSFPVACVRDVGLSMAGALSYAASVRVNGRPLGLIHRDISPHNILVSSTGRCFLTDFGVARTTYQVHETAHGEIRGKPGYMSPEQVNEERLDHRSDIFCLGIVLWELLTQKRLFKRGTLLKTLMAVSEDVAPDVRSLEPSIPSPLSEVVARCLQKDPTKRYQDPSELEAALAALAHLGGRSESMLSRLVRDCYPEGAFDVQAKVSEALRSPFRAGATDQGQSDSGPGFTEARGPSSSFSHASLPAHAMPRKVALTHALRTTESAATFSDTEARIKAPHPISLAALGLGAVGLAAAVAVFAPGFSKTLSIEKLPEQPEPEPEALFITPSEPEDSDPPKADPALTARLFEALKFRRAEDLKQALEAGAPVDVPNSGGWLPIHVAARGNDGPALRLLVDAGAYLEARTSDAQYTALHLAAKYGNTEAVRILLSAGADPNSRSSLDDTPLLSALDDRTLQVEDVLRILLDGGADPNATGHMDHRAVERAVVQNHVMGLSALLSFGVKVPPPQSRVVGLAALESSPEVLRLILSNVPRRAIPRSLPKKARAAGRRRIARMLERRL
ncbi:MAG: protein kinase [Myxococcota bacterium]